MALRHIKTKRSLKDENKHLHSLVKHLQIELENARLDISIKNDAINGYKNERESNYKKPPEIVEFEQQYTKFLEDIKNVRNNSKRTA